MARNGSGVYSLPAGSLVTTDQDIEASQHNTPLQDLELDQNTPRPVVAGGTGANTAASARTNLGLAIGTDVQAQNALLAALAGLTTVANQMPYFTGANAVGLATLTDFARLLLDDENSAAARTTLQLGDAATSNKTGTVSGASTSPIMELGENANGRYLRLFGGTQICYHRLEGLTTDQLWTFPAAFSFLPRVQATANTGLARFATSFDTTTTTTNTRVFTAAGVASNEWRQMFAIGLY